MKNYIFNLIKLPQIYFTIIRNLKFQREIIQKTLTIDIEESKICNDTSLDEHDYKKMTNYYGYAVPAILGESFGILRGKKLTLKERAALTNLGALTGLFDDFFDKRDLNESYIRSLVENPEKLSGNNSNEKLFIKFYNRALDDSANANTLKEYFLKVYDAQIQSKSQINSDIKREEIEAITFLKGGISLLFYRSVFSDEMIEPEKLLLYKIGGVMQLENDIFDVYKDYKDGIKTLVTIENCIDNLRSKYNLLIHEIFALAHQTNFQPKNTKKFLRIVSLVLCRGFVCLDMLKYKERLSNNSFSIEKYDRKDLICDMEKPINFLKTINYYARYKY